MIRGQRDRINLGSSIFSDFVEAKDCLVDKSAFIEHVLDDPSLVLLITRPRRMGKSLNLNMLASFIDNKFTTPAAELFKGFYLQGRPCFEQANSAPVILLNFKELNPDDYKSMFILKIKSIAENYLVSKQYSNNLAASLDKDSPVSKSSLRFLTESLHAAYGVKPFVLIDEYDKLMMDAANKPEFEEIRNFTKTVLSSVLKDNPSLGKAVLSGVNRIAQESLFSDLNNLDVIDVFSPSAFDADFGFTEEEVCELCTPEELSAVREWYNGERIGKQKVYFTFSVMNYLSKGILNNYWGQSGTTGKIKAHLNTARLKTINGLIQSFNNPGRKDEAAIDVDQRLTAEDLQGYAIDSAFYSLLVQTGYLTFDPTDTAELCYLRLANRELAQVWRKFILRDVSLTTERSVREALATVATPEHFAIAFGELLSNRLSYFDMSPGRPEMSYHVFVAGLLGGSQIAYLSNRESGFGRYDIMALLPDKTIIFEFKVAKTAEGIGAAVREAIEQISVRNYAADAPKDKPLYAAGVGFYSKEAQVSSVCLRD